MKEVKVLTFGAVTDITGNNNFLCRNMDTTFDLMQYLEQQFPQLKTIKYAVAVNKKIVQNDTLLDDNAIVAILPPFSGG